MVDPQIQEVFDEHVRRYDSMGNGNFGVRNGFLDPKLEVLAQNTHDGSLWLRGPVFGEVYNCARVTHDLAADLSERGYEVKRKFTISPEGYTQNYLEVFDPESDEWIQLDATPWYQEIGTEHKETGEHPKQENVEMNASFITHEGGQFLSTQRQEDGSFIDAYLAGGYFSQTQNLANLQQMIAKQKQGEDVDALNNPHYQFRLWSRQGHSCDAKTTSRADIVYEVLDSAKIAQVRAELGKGAWLEDPRGSLERLIEEGAARVRVAGYSDYLFNSAQLMIGQTELLGRDSFDYLDELRSRGDTTPETIEWLNHNLGTLANVVFNVGPRLQTLSGENLRMGQPCAQVDISLDRFHGSEGGFGDDKPKIDLSPYANLFTDLKLKI